MEFLMAPFDENSKDPLYYQLYKHLMQKIWEGRLQGGEKLPGKRTAAAQLGVSVNTVDQAYQMLAAEGYVRPVPRSGFVVEALDGEVPPPKDKHEEESALQVPAPANTCQFSFATGGIDPSLFPRTVYTRIYKEVLAEQDSLFVLGDGRGDETLRTAIAGYLQSYRGVLCNAQQVVVGAGLEVLVGMLARLFAGQTAAVESPGYPKTSAILGNSGLNVKALPVDEQGMQVKTLEESGATLAYLTPSHQFPTGGVMPVGRRAQLLAWAAKGNHVLIEDDYDSEFRFDGRPLPSLQSLDTQGHVVYAGTFSRSLAPGLRVAYLVLPRGLTVRWAAAYGSYACTVSRPEQNTLAKFMREGHFARGLNRMRNVYRARRNRLVQVVEAQLGKSPPLLNTHTGLYCLLPLAPHTPGIPAAQRARAAGVLVRALGEYALAEQSALPREVQNALVLGYGGLADNQIEPAVSALAAAVRL